MVRMKRPDLRRNLALLAFAVFLLGGLLASLPHPHVHSLLQDSDDCQACRLHTTPVVSESPQPCGIPHLIPQEGVSQPTVLLCTQQAPSPFSSRAPPLPL